MEIIIGWDILDEWWRLVLPPNTLFLCFCLPCVGWLWCINGWLLYWEEPISRWKDCKYCQQLGGTNLMSCIFNRQNRIASYNGYSQQVVAIIQVCVLMLVFQLLNYLLIWLFCFLIKHVNWRKHNSFGSFFQKNITSCVWDGIVPVICTIFRVTLCTWSLVMLFAYWRSVFLVHLMFFMLSTLSFVIWEKKLPCLNIFWMKCV